MADSLFVKTVGQGPAVVLLHGWGMNGAVWNGVAEVLAPRFRVYLVDLPGFGASPETGEASLERWALAVQEAVPAGAVWVGWSLGGMVALAAAVGEAPPRGLVLVATTPRFVQGEAWPDAVAPQVLESFSEQLDADYRGTLLRFLALQAKGSDRARDEVRLLREQVFARGEPRPTALASGLRLLRESDLIEQLGRVPCRTLIIQGEGDNLAPVAGAQETARALPDGQLVVVPGAGHAPFISHPEVFIEHLTGFLDSVFADHGRV